MGLPFLNFFSTINHDSIVMITSAAVGTAFGFLSTILATNLQNGYQNKKTNLENAYYLLMQTSKITSDILSYAKTFLLQEDEYNKKPTEFKFQKIVPVIGRFPSQMNYTLDKMTFMLNGEHNGFCSELLDLESCQNFIVNLATLYESKRNEFFFKLKQLIEKENKKISEELNVEQLVRDVLFGEVRELEDIIHGLLLALKDGSKLSLKLSNEIYPTISAIIKDKRFKSFIQIPDVGILDKLLNTTN